MMIPTRTFSRRSLLKSGGALVISFGAAAIVPRLILAQNASPGGAGQLHPVPREVDSFLAIHEDGTVTIFTSHVDIGTGINTVYRQIAAEELDIPVERFTVIQGDTATTPNHGGTGGSSGVPRAGADIRQVAATARMALLERASTQLQCEASLLTISKGEVAPIAGGKGISVGSLVGGKRFDLKVDPKAPLKDRAKYTVVGKPILRTDVPPKCTGRHVYIQDFHVPEMLHGRVIRPAAIGARLIAVDETSIGTIPDVRIVRVESFLGIVARNEWAAVRAARELKTTWSNVQPLPLSDGLERTMQTAASDHEQSVIERGNTAATLRTAVKQLTATYYWPFQGHASLGPSCVIADVKDSATTIWSSTQDTFGLRSLLAKIFNIPPEKVQVNYMDGSGSYGSNGAYDAAADAVLLSRAVGKAVRLQWMREDEHAWDPKGPAQLLELRGGIDADGKIVAWESKASGFTGPQWTSSLLGPTSAGMPSAPEHSGAGPVTQNLDPPYPVPNLLVSSRALNNTQIRLSNLRAPGKMGTVFAVESFTDELASAAAIDAVAFRRGALTDPRALAVIGRAADMIGWQPRPSPNTHRLPTAAGQDGLLIGRGFAYVHYKQAESYIGMAMEVAVDRALGKVTVRRVACAHDCGLIMNPDGLLNQVEGNIMQALSRTLHEEVTFDGTRITSVNWSSYPILRFSEAPSVQVALLDHPDQPAFGAGEAAGAPVPAALANAIFDATGVRLRAVPFTAARVRAAFS
jgi:CO/xanthine dehydrogenase Mo-binding subunit